VSSVYVDAGSFGVEVSCAAADASKAATTVAATVKQSLASGLTQAELNRAKYAPLITTAM
jgi:predicted Zn-dependent peptidase